MKMLRLQAPLDLGTNFLSALHGAARRLNLNEFIVQYTQYTLIDADITSITVYNHARNQPELCFTKDS